MTLGFADAPGLTATDPLGREVLSLGPLVLIVIKLAGVLDPHAQDHVVEQITGLVGAQGGQAVAAVIASAEQNPTTGTLAAGAAGSLVVLLLWVYYSGIVFFLGAEITEAWAHEQRTPIVPDETAERVPGGAERSPATLAHSTGQGG